MLEIKKFIFNPFSENTYVLWEKESLECMIIDPGCSDEDEEYELFDFIESNNLKPKYLINTHCHIDHILGVNSVLNKFKIKYFAPEKDLPLLEHAISQAEMFGLRIDEIRKPDEYLSEELILKIGNEKIRCLYTPGHTPGEYCLYSDSNKICITGDVLFQQSIGRTDLWGGNFEQLLKSIENKLLTLPDEVVIYPGHGDVSTIGEEKKFNPFLKNLG
ncbi:MAG: MBL fold metallo-hydrolase [Ignavibacterium sp.]|nr:MBL fold metallo-hydrolase [Ignavibacterium sp.]MDW8375894.1 MBL fold metallo-hydrolase [Ignavibacteriales bacterium]